MPQARVIAGASHVELRDGDAAFCVREDLSAELYISRQGDNDPIYWSTAFVMSLIVLTNDPELSPKFAELREKALERLDNLKTGQEAEGEHN